MKSFILVTRPPLGLKPEYIHEAQAKQERASEILAAMQRYQRTGKPMPKAWLTELNRLR